MVSEGGEVHVTHRDDYPYNEWNLVELAKQSGLVLKEKLEFSKKNYPGYHNKRGGGIKSNKQFPLEQTFTFKFSLVPKNSTQLLADNGDQNNITAGDDVTSITADFDDLQLNMLTDEC